MRSKYFNVVVLFAAILAFLPIGAVDYLLDNYVRQRETMVMQRAVDSLSAEIGTSADDTIAALRRILNDSPSLCTPTFITNVHTEMENSLHLKDVLVEDRPGAQFCNAFGDHRTYVPISSNLSIAGHDETVAVVKLDGLDAPLLKISAASGDRIVSAIMPLLGYGGEGLLARVQPAKFVRISLTDGTPVVAAGLSKAFDHRTSNADFISAQSLAGEIPLRAEAGTKFSVVRNDYSNLDAGFTLVAGAMSAAFLLLMLQYVRRSNISGFELERAIAHGELKPYYQPVIDLSTGRIAGCEMLCRWERKNGRVILPGTFIDYAEQSGLAIPMTVSLMQQVRADLGELYFEHPELKVSINLFEGHFRDRSIVDDVQAIFGGSSISFHQLVFEITERRPLNSTQAFDTIAGLHGIGAKLAMDDAGTGHSNLAYLQTLGVDVIKLDRVFVDMIKADTTQVPVLDGLIAVARDLGTEVVAEGVETPAQAVYLRQRGVFMAQGFLFAPALKAKSFKELVRALNAPADAHPHLSVAA